MDIRVEFDAKAALRTIGEIGRSKTAEAVRRGLLESCRLVQSEARSRHQFTSRTGVLERSIEYRLERGSLVGVVKISDAAPYGVFVHEPTGIYGPTKERYQIRPKRKQALRWAADGKLHLLGWSIIQVLRLTVSSMRQRIGAGNEYGRFLPVIFKRQFNLGRGADGVF